MLEGLFPFQIFSIKTVFKTLNFKIELIPLNKTGKCLIQGAIVSGHVLNQLHAHILERQQNSKHSKMCAFSWSKHGRSQSPFGLIKITNQCSS